MPKLPSSIPSRSGIARNWHLYLYRLCLPLLVAGNVTRIVAAQTRLDVADGVFGVVLATLLWLMSWSHGAQRLRQIDIGVSLMLWISFIAALLQVGRQQQTDSIGVLQTFLYWAPLLAFYWGIVYHDRRVAGIGQVVALYAAMLLIDPTVLALTGASLFLQGTLQAVCQGLLVIIAITIFSTIYMQMIENEALFLSAEHRANHDELTGLLNRRTFAQHFPALARRSSEQQSKLVLMLIDLDHFKTVNDRHGHAAGDQVLIHLSSVLETGLRGDDLLYRWGGDEFAVLMRAIDLDAAARLAERLRQKIERTNFGFTQPITISIGVACHRAGESYQELFRRADDAMLGGKQNGHNRVGIAADHLIGTLGHRTEAA